MSHKTWYGRVCDRHSYLRNDLSPVPPGDTALGFRATLSFTLGHYDSPGQDRVVWKQLEKGSKPCLLFATGFYKLDPTGLPQKYYVFNPINRRDTDRGVSLRSINWFCDSEPGPWFLLTRAKAEGWMIHLSGPFLLKASTFPRPKLARVDSGLWPPAALTHGSHSWESHFMVSLFLSQMLVQSCPRNRDSAPTHIVLWAS